MPSDVNTRVRLMCVDDNEMVVESLHRLAVQLEAIEWVGGVTNTAVAIQEVRSKNPHVVLMDVDMPGVDTFALVAQMAREMPEVRVVMLSGHVQPAYIERAFDSGAWGYLSKSDDSAMLIEAVLQAGKGDVVMSKEVRAVHQRHVAGDASP